MGIVLTKIATEQVSRIVAEQELDPDNTYLRVGLAGGGCSGFQFILDLTSRVEGNDEIFQEGDIKVACDPKSYLYLNGTTIDFKDGLMGSGFTFDVPMSTGKCGCGSSFAF